MFLHMRRVRSCLVTARIVYEGVMARTGACSSEELKR